MTNQPDDLDAMLEAREAARTLLGVTYQAHQQAIDAARTNDPNTAAVMAQP